MRDEEVRALQELAGDALYMKEMIEHLKGKLAESHKQGEERVTRLKEMHRDSHQALTLKQEQEISKLRQEGLQVICIRAFFFVLF